MKIVRYLTLVIVIFVISVICYRYYDTNDYVTLWFGNQKMDFYENSTDEILYLDSFNNEKDLIIKSFRNKEKIKIDGKRILFYKNCGKKEIDRYSFLTVSIKYNNASKYKNYKIYLLPEFFPEYKTSGESKTKGDYYLTTYTSNVNYIYKLNNQGKVTFYKKTNARTYIFKKELINNKTYYTYIDSNVEIDNSNIENNNLVYSINVLDENYNLVKKFSLSNNYNLNLHDYIMLDLDWFIVSYYEKDDIAENTNDKKIIIGEFKNGKKIWEYSEEKYDMIYNYDDSLHFNSFKIDSDDNLLVSFRNTSEIMKIDRKTGEPIWILNGTNNMFDKEIFKNQHAIEKYKDKYIVYSNNDSVNGINEATTKVSNLKSSIVEFKIDEDERKIKEYKTYSLPVLSGIYSSAYPINDDIYVISYGAFNDSANSNFEEINLKTGEVLFSFKYLGSSYIYRVYKF